MPCAPPFTSRSPGGNVVSLGHLCHPRHNLAALSIQHNHPQHHFNNSIRKKNSAKGKNKTHQTASSNHTPSQQRGAELYQSIEHPTTRQHPRSSCRSGDLAESRELTFAGDADAVQPGFLRRKETRSQAGWVQTCFVDAFAPSQTGGVPVWFVLKHPLLSLRSSGAHGVIHPAELSVPSIF